MQLTPSALQAIYLNFSTMFQRAYLSALPFHERLASTMPSTTRETHHGWMGRLPRMREWVGARVINNAAAREYTIVNKDWEDTIALKRNDIKDDQIGLYAPSIQMLGEQARLLPDQLIAELIKAGGTSLCFDGQNYFDTDHPVDPDDASKGTQSNLYSSKPLTADNYAAVRAGMMSLKGEDEQPLNISPNLLVVPPTLEYKARTIVNADTIPNAAGTASQSNVLKGTAEVLVVPYLAGQDDTWYLLDTTKPVKPFIWQEREATQFTSMTEPTSENVFHRKEFLFGADRRGNVGYSLWFLAAKATAS